MNNSKIFSRFYYLDAKFEKKFRFGNFSFWHFVRIFVINEAYSKFGESSYNSKKSFKHYKFSRLFLTLISVKNLRRSEVCFLISSRSDIEMYLSNTFKQVFENALVISVLGTTSLIKKDFIYLDFLKATIRMIFWNRTKSFSNIAREKFIEGICVYYYSKFLFFFIRPKKVYFINWYEYYPSLLALNNNVESIEIQHGVIYRYHYGYNVNASIYTKIPNIFLIWNNIFLKSINVGRKINFDIIDRFELKSVGDEKCFEKVCVIISQSTIRDALTIKLRELQILLKSFDLIIYRLHPKDEHLFQEIQLEFTWLNNLRISKPSVESVDVLLNKNWTYMGVYSTLILDLILNNFKVKILNIAGADIIEDLISLDNVEKL